MTRGILPILALVALIAALPLVTASNTAINFVVFVLIIALGAQGWNLLGGVGGQFSFGHAAFFGTGAYVSAVLQARFGVNAWVAFAAGVAMGALVGWVIGFLSFRAGLRGSYFALVTLAFAEVLRILANALPITGGGAGLLLKLDVGLGNFQFSSRAVFSGSRWRWWRRGFCCAAGSRIPASARSSSPCARMRMRRARSASTC